MSHSLENCVTSEQRPAAYIFELLELLVPTEIVQLIGQIPTASKRVV